MAAAAGAAGTGAWGGLAGSPGFWTVAEWIFLFTGGMTVAYMLKLFFAIFVEVNQDPVRQAEYDGMSGRYMKPASTLALVVPAVLVPVMGLFPGVTMNRLADLGQGFFLAEGMEHGVHYFSLGNLKGGLVSVTIGGLVYGWVIRQWMMGKMPVAGEGASGQELSRGYLDRWPQALDLEHLLYRPVLGRLLPGI